VSALTFEFNEASSETRAAWYLHETFSCIKLPKQMIQF
jgi:hypothetical protein